MTEFNIPKPFDSEEFVLLKKGVADNSSIDVLINKQKDFAFLHPTPRGSYDNYMPRVKKFNLVQYKKKLDPIKKRLAKIEHLLNANLESLLEIGAGDGSFLQEVRRIFPKIHLTAVDKDQYTEELRSQAANESYRDLDKPAAQKRKYDIICLFHVFEHILSPSSFLAKISQLMTRDSLVILEVPSLSDPLLSIYDCKSYSEFYFQEQHPFIYSEPSIKRLLEFNGFEDTEVIYFQRYGLENHLNWLTENRPGGNETFQHLFHGLEDDYISTLEKNKKTDTVFWIGKFKQ